MKCFSCGKNFDYEKYYGICPKCGCYNKEKSAEEVHREYHDAFDGGYRHGDGAREGQETRQQDRQTPPPAPQSVQSHVQAEERKKKKSKLLPVSVLFLIVCILFAAVVPELVGKVADRNAQKRAMTGSIPITEQQPGEFFAIQKVRLKVVESRILADWTELIGLEEGMKLVAVRVQGTSDGEYEKYNRVAMPYLYAEGTYRRCVPNYEFEPYSSFYGLSLLESSALQMDEACDGWYVFVTEEENTEGLICFEELERNGSEDRLISIRGIPVAFEEEGGETDEE